MIRAALFTLVVAACGSGSPGGPQMNNSLKDPAATTQSSDVISSDVLAREPLANTSHVQHILIGWKDLGDAYNGHMDSRAEARTKAQAEALVRQIVAQLKGGADFVAAMKTHSEDPGSATTAHIYEVSPDAPLVLEFRQIGLRLHPGEIGVVESEFGFHIVRRID